jgi:hypothetical protein
VKVIVLRTTGPVTQADMENILQLDAQIETLRITRDRIAAGIIERLSGGSPIEPGARTCRLDESYSGKVRRQRLIVR